MTETLPGLNLSKKLKCRDCPRCYDGAPGKFNIDGVHCYICGMSGNIVYKDPWRQERLSGSGYINHGPGGCGLYDSVEDALSDMTEAEKRRWKWEEK